MIDLDELLRIAVYSVHQGVVISVRIAGRALGRCNVSSGRRNARADRTYDHPSRIVRAGRRNACTCRRNVSIGCRNACADRTEPGHRSS